MWPCKPHLKRAKWDHFLDRERPVIHQFRASFNARFVEDNYASLLRRLERRCGMPVEFRVAETPIFVPRTLLEELAAHGANLACDVIGNPQCLDAARNAIPAGYRVANETAHPNFLTADFALIRDASGALVPRLVEIQAFPSVYGYQTELCSAYRDEYGLGQGFGVFLGGLDEQSYWQLLARTIVAGHNPENVVLTELDPLHQKTLPDFEVTARQLGIAVVDIRALEPSGNRLHYRNAKGRLVLIHRIYNRTIADELIAKRIRLPFDLERDWQVEWAGHPNWYFLISKFSIPWLTSPVVPPAVFLSDFLSDVSDRNGRARLAAAGVPLPQESGPATVYNQLLLKPLFSFAGKGIEFDPSQQLLESIPSEKRSEFLLQQRMRFEPTIETPYGLTQAEIRILYAWPDRAALTPALSLVRLGRGKMMGVDHNRDLRWVGASAAFYPASAPSDPAS
jgi:hypothetical protein